MPLQGPKGIDSKRVEIRVVGALSAASSNTLPRTAVENTEAPFIKAHAAKIAFKKAADAQDGAAKAESKRIANEEKERTKREKLRKDREKLRRIKYKSDEARLAFEVLKSKHDNPDDADSIEKKYQEEKKLIFHKT